MFKVKQLYAAFKVLNEAENLGDFAVLKADAFGAKLNPELSAKMAKVVGYYPYIDIGKLSQLPEGTFGHEYAHHMKKNNLKPLNVSPELSEVAQRNVFALRYAVTHDIFHVLLGFDTSYAGEIGVLAFAAEQNYSQALKISLLFAQVIYPILAPFQLREIFANIYKGKAMGKKASFLLGYRFEDYWEQPLNKVRAELALTS